MNKKNDKILGVLGGMGPLASAEFLKTIYEQNISDEAEQGYPNVILHSITSMPDRTNVLMNNSDNRFLNRLVYHLELLCKADVSHIIICCMTSHCFLHMLPQLLLDKIVSLIPVAINELERKKEPALLLATMGTYHERLFEKEALLNNSDKYLVIPSDEDKQFIHNLIYDNLKKGKNISEVHQKIQRMLDNYKINSFVSGCTEFHLLVKYVLESGSGINFVDPLVSVAREYCTDSKYSASTPFIGGHILNMPCS